MTIRWTGTALRDLESVHAYIGQDKPDAAASTVERILAAIEALIRYPEIGRKGRVSGTRELVVPPFVIVYRPRRDLIELIAVLHGARRWPDSF
jgi:addiction module RelE/StbE family toxin